MPQVLRTEAPKDTLDTRPMPPPMGFYLPGQAGNLFAMYYRANESVPEAGDVLYVHPFAGEMAASRNVIAALSRDLARMGFGVLTVDLFGCGDSSGDFREARWEIWRDDLAAAVRWLQEQGRDQISLWGLRLGALLAMDFAVHSGENYERMVLWQPVLSGQAMLTQFLHMNLDELGTGATRQLTNPEYRGSLPAGHTIEVAGYELAAELIHSIDKLNLAPLGNRLSGPVHWIEMGQRAEATLRPESLRVVEEWSRHGIQVSTRKLNGLPFWLFPHSLSPQRIAQDVTAMFTNEEV
ncbi:MAG: hydrolase 2, exosortase A system-associated [Candidatus Sulfotelmatobacter sp.]